MKTPDIPIGKKIVKGAYANNYGNSLYLTQLDSRAVTLTNPAEGPFFEHNAGKKQYELANHLGNVLVVFSDKKVSHEGGTGVVGHYTASLLNVQDYFPFGWTMPGRKYSSPDYRYGFNGMEKDDEISGSGNSYTTEFRQLDPRLGGRWWSMDRIVKPWESPYAGFANNPVFFADPTGLTPEDPNGSGNDDIWQSRDGDGCYTGVPEIFKLDEVTIGGEKPPVEVADNTKVTSPTILNSPGPSKSSTNNTFFKMGTQQQLPPQHTNISPSISNETKSLIGTGLYGGGAGATMMQEIMQNNAAVQALKEGKMLVVINGEVKVWSLGFRGNQYVSSGLVNSSRQAFLSEAQPLLKLSNAAKVTGAVFGIVSLGMNIYEITENSSSVDNWINLGVGVLSLNPQWGVVVYPSYMIVRGAIETPSAFFGGSDKGYVNGWTGEPMLYNYYPTMCFIKGTKIFMADGSQRNIEDIYVGDSVKTYNFTNNQIENKSVIKIDTPLHDHLIDILFEDGIVNSNTFDHPYLVKGKGWCSYDPSLTKKRYGIDVQPLKPGDICYLAQDNKIREIAIVSINESIGERRTFNLSEIEDNHNFFANGILVHNKHISKNKYEDITLNVDEAPSTSSPTAKKIRGTFLKKRNKK